ncbi:MAG: hydrogenase 4 subunit F [Patescibacteria group bacterium]|jgi:hydrogenase-4 component F
MILALIIVIPLLAAALSAVVKKRTRLLETFTVVSSLSVFVLSIAVAREVLTNQSYVLLQYLNVGALGAILLLLISFIGLIASLYSVGYLRAEMKKEIIGFSRVRQYYVLLNIFLATMLCAVSASNPIMTWIAVEATTLSTAFLISFYGKPSSIEAAWKYLIINSVGLLLAFFGTLLFLSASMSIAGDHSLISWNDVLANASSLNPVIAKIAFLFILVGYGTKMGLVPMHTWLPDAHGKAPVPISGLLSGVLLNIAFFAILRFKVVVDKIDPGFAQNLMIYFGLFSILLSALMIYLQSSYKRLLAYSTIEHMGIVSLGIGFGGAGVFAAFLHMIYHSLAKPLLFLASGNIFLKYSSTKIAKIRGVAITLPITGILFVIGILAITGVPPFGIFLTEFSILAAGIKLHPVITVLALFSIALIFIGFLRHTSAMVFSKNEESLAVGESSKWNILPLILLASVLIILSVYLPGPLKTLITRATLVY